MLLIVSKPKIQAEDLSDMMNFMGVLSLALVPSEALFEISENYRALIVISSDKIDENIEDELLLRAKRFNIPSFMLGKCEDGEKYNFTLRKNLSASEILDGIIEKCKGGGFKLPGEYKTEELDVSLTCREALWFSKNILLTKTEKMIVRVLLRFFPKPVKPSEILKLAFRKKRLPDEASIRTHISKINKKSMIISGRMLILNFEKLGYVLFQKELAYILGTSET